MMTVRVSIDGEFVNTLSFGKFVEAMIDCGHSPEDVSNMVLGLIRNQTVKDGGGASPVFEYVLQPTVPSPR